MNGNLSHVLSVARRPPGRAARDSGQAPGPLRGDSHPSRPIGPGLGPAHVAAA